MELEVAVVKQDAGLCRCCHSEGCFKDLNEEYVWMDETVNYGEMLQECFNIKILQYSNGNGINGASTLICEDCAVRLREACIFRKQVLSNEKKLAELLGHVEPEDSKEQAFTIKVKTEPQEIDIEEHGVATQSYTRPAVCYVRVSRQALFDKMQQQKVPTLDEKLEYLQKYLLSFTDYSEEHSKAVIKRFAALKYQFKQRWYKAHRKQNEFYKKNSEWLKGMFAIAKTINFGPKEHFSNPHVKSEDMNAGAAVDSLHMSGISKIKRISFFQRYLEIRRTI
ncbi:uncharacterized protein LOC133531567 isoform X2 [Cydia pomonella]|uniref:uncharacterized protein LOC133531567 isoform X2 n=1 Tax=Cydia pomonella TaxID=82600 RepID=UPI002ADE37CC|nr:uncharacterized protein LOC133531567 isoform X2 [Cydia pomonella]